MKALKRTTLWGSALFACAGVILILAFLLGREPDDMLLSGATFAALLSSALLLLVVSLIGIGSAKRAGRRPSSALAPSALDPFLSEQFAQRQDVLSGRLAIDDPHFCTHAQAPCRTWSFCGALPPGNSAAAGENAVHSMPREDSAAGAGNMPIIERSSVNGACLAEHPAPESGRQLPL